MSDTDQAGRFWDVGTDVTETIVGVAGNEPTPQDFRLMADNLPVLCWMARPDGYITWYNRRWHDYCGTTPDEMEGWGWEAVHDADMLPAVKARWAASIADGDMFEMTFPLRGADGMFRPFLTRISPMRGPDGKVARWFGINLEVGAQKETERALKTSQDAYATLTDAMPQMVWSTRPDGHHDYYNAQWYAFTGTEPGSTDGEGWAEIFHPDDQPRAWEKWRHSLATGEPYEIEYRLRHRNGQYRWVLGRALPVRGEDGRIVRWIGTCTDIHIGKLNAEHNEILSRELSHRIKNIFSIIGGLIGLSARESPGSRPFARAIADRIASLGRAHEFARPHSELSRPEIDETTLSGLLRRLFEPYGIAGQERITVRGVDPEVDDKGATPMALLFHELATNAAKYGALSNEAGRVTVDVADDGERLAIDWRETGGPAVNGPPEHEGFGTRLAQLSVGQQLGGTISRDWRPDGLVVRVEVPRNALARS